MALHITLYFFQVKAAGCGLSKGQDLSSMRNENPRDHLRVRTTEDRERFLQSVCSFSGVDGVRRMGHRKTQHRESRGGSLDHSKDKHDANESSHGTSKRDKRSHKRKREYDHDSKRRHKERHRVGHSSLKSSRKGKSREKGHRKDFGISDSTSGSSLLSSQAAHQLGISTHRSGAGLLSKHAGSTKSYLDDDGHRKHSSKRARLSRQNPSGHHDGPGERSRTKRENHKTLDSELGKAGQYMGAVSYSNVSRYSNETTRSQGEGMGSEGSKDNMLEVELRQKALENFMQHQDGSCKIDCLASISDDEAGKIDTTKERAALGKVKEVDKHMPAVGSPMNVDATKGVKRWPASCVTVAPATDDVDCLAKEDLNNLEEGEIKSGNETEQENGGPVVDKFLCRKTEENLLASRENCERQDDLRMTSGREVERAGVANASPFVNVNHGLAQEETVKGNTGVDSAAAQSNHSSNFQEKTMSVMRGGEMVQVSYKVYIPQRAAELARRRLQR